tara:strand:- start:1477 stop:2562 length:1086 start_codon:yes stop_codon:yes gene_type:complete
MESIIKPNYSIFFGNTGYVKLLELINKNNYDKILILSDSNTLKYCLPILKDQLFSTDSKSNSEIENKIYSYTVNSGEQAKNLNELKKICEFLISKGFKRNSLIINLGGGIVSDLGGFVSSIYMRGIDFVNIPTSLLGMVDASIGGKTGIDLNDLKNIIGSFEFAKIIIIDLNFLSTLPIRQINSGFAEMIKHSLIDSKKHWNKISSVNFSKDVDSSLIYNSIMTKIKIIENDPKESSSRKFLNFGHTIGHAIESFLLNSDREILHGEAILIGIILESYLSQKLLNFDAQLTLNIKNYILKFSKQIDFSNEDIKHVIGFLKYDKKNTSDEPLFVLLNEIGKPSYDNIVSNEEIIEAFKFYAI